MIKARLRGCFFNQHIVGFIEAYIFKDVTIF